MSLIKSNSALVAFTKAGNNQNSKFIFLHFIQSMSLDIKTNRINSKHIGSSKALTNQFVEPDVNLNITFLNTKDFFNEFLFGFNFGQGSALKNIINLENFHKNSLILLNDIDDQDLIDNGSKSLKYYASIGNLYLENYSLSYKINSLPIVSAAFVGNNLKIGNSEEGFISEIPLYGFEFNDWDGLNNQEKEEIFSNLKSDTEQKSDRLIYVMNGISAVTDLLETAKFPGSSFSSFLDGVIQDLDITINFNRKKFLFFNETNNAADRKIILPIVGDIKLTGISAHLNIGDLKTFFSANEKFKIDISIIDDQQVVSNVICNNVVIESYSYSINLNGFLEYSISCSFQANEDFEIKTSVFEINSANYNFLTSENQSLTSLNGDSFISADFIKN
jgi:hypothetical protein